MNGADPYKEALVQEQALTEAIAVLVGIEDALDGARNGIREGTEELTALGDRLRAMTERFAPRLNMVGQYPLKLAHMRERMENGTLPSRDDCEAVRHVLAEITSQHRMVSAQLAQMNRWVKADHADLARAIAGLAETLQAVRLMLEHSNAVRTDALRADTFRDTVVALLAAYIEELKAPAVNTRRLGGLAEMLRRVAKRSAEKKLGEGVEAAIEQAAEQAGELVDKAQNLPGLDGFL